VGGKGENYQKKEAKDPKGRRGKHKGVGRTLHEKRSQNVTEGLRKIKRPHLGRENFEGPSILIHTIEKHHNRKRTGVATCVRQHEKETDCASEDFSGAIKGRTAEENVVPRRGKRCDWGIKME